MHKKKIGVIIYANPDDYPPTINAVTILSKEFDIIIICRNQNKTQITYHDNVRLYRLGKLKTSREKETQGAGVKIIEYILFVMRTIFYIRFHNCRLIYSYDMHAFVAGFLASRVGRNIPLIYHNHELTSSEEVKGLSCIIKWIELSLARYADKIVFPDIGRARFFQSKAKLKELPVIVMNVPLRVDKLPPNKLKEILKTKGFSEGTKVILYQGAVAKAHALTEIIKSMVYWPENTILVIIGIIYGEFDKEINALAKAFNVSSRVIILPFVPFSQLFSYTVGAYIGLALFKSEHINLIFIAGASNKIFEYLAMGIPVITNDSPYFREVLDSSFVYFAKPDSVEDIGKVINSVFLNEEEYCHKCQAARNAHLSKLNYEEQFSPLIEYIRKVTEQDIR